MLDIPCQAQVVEVVAFAGFIGELGTALGGVFQGVQLADHDCQVGLLGSRGGGCVGDRQGASSQCDKARKEDAVSECCEAQVLDHGWALVIRVGTRVQ